MSNPYAARGVRDAAPSFPEARLRRAGATDAEMTHALNEWDAMSAAEQAGAAAALAQLTDDELASSLGETREPAPMQSLTGVVTPLDDPLVTPLGQGGPAEAAPGAGAPPASAPKPPKPRKKAR